MANLTIEAAIGRSWTRIPLAAGSTYRLAVIDRRIGGRVELAATDDTTAPTVRGVPLTAAGLDVAAAADRHYWARVDRDEAGIAATPLR